MRIWKLRKRKPLGSPSPTTPMEEEWPSKGGLVIIDYVHDKTTMSLEPRKEKL
jgi:hypothetical protein